MSNVKHHLTFDFSKRGILIPAAIMLACWLPYLIALAPGTMGWDTTFMIEQCYPNHGPMLSVPWSATNSYVDCQFSDHHPLFDTLLFGFFALGSAWLTDSWNAGLTVYIALQATCMSLALSAVCAYLKRLGCPRPCSLGALAFFCLLPLFPVNAATIVKDTLFCWIFVIYVLLACEVVRTKGSALQSTGFFASLLAASALVALTKKTGMYVVVPTSLALCLACKEHRLRAASPALVTAALMLAVLPHVVFPLLDVIPGGRQESLGSAMQQTARYVVEHGDEVSDEERAAIDAVMPVDELARAYDPRSVDPVKFTYRWETATGDDVGAYLRVWLAQGLRHPDTYLRATWSVLEPFFDPATRFDLYTLAGGSPKGHPKTQFYASTEGLRTTLLGLVDALFAAPVTGLMCSNVLYALILPASTLLCVLAFGREERWMLVPVALAWASLLVSPVAMTRYLFPLVYLAPLMVGCAWRSVRGRGSAAVAEEKTHEPN